ncbi:MAG: hypothetical protein COW12_05575 [Candidatus Omnitrophica bacterium CG12_big_fil_rev_8_21_14_0_65_45_16]|nr:MAG: hypothetical protein COW12_05575 [Candidatus Omnitrophica bacterium CG12_big_fil_rev_8_21_14_0_65_45_16]
MLNLPSFDKNYESDSKLKSLSNAITDLNNVVVLFSGGIDSSFLLYLCTKSLPKPNILNVIGVSQSLPERELIEARAFSKLVDVPLIELKTNELENELYSNNSGNRCYHCKTELNDVLLNFMNQNPQYTNWNIIDGLQASDKIEHRPGFKANEKYQIKHPLYDLKFTKDEIRSYCKSFGLSVYDKPESACLSSRVMVGTKVTASILSTIERAENLLLDSGIIGSRVRIHNLNNSQKTPELLARIELRNQKEMQKLIGADHLLADLRKLPISFITIDLDGYKEGGFSNQKLKVL